MKECKENDKENDGLEATFRGEPQRLFQFFLDSLEDFFNPLVIIEGASFFSIVFSLCHNGLFFSFSHCMK